MKLIHSTTFQLCVIVLIVGALAAGYSDDVTWLHWFDRALDAVFIYAGKEGIKYASAAYEGRKSD